MRYIFFAVIITLVSCTKESHNIVGTWQVDLVEWDGGRTDFNGERSVAFTDNGNILIDGIDRYDYIISDDHHIIIDGNSYQYSFKKKTLVIYYWYMWLDHSSFPNIVWYLTK